jgi:hypothetical protein
MRFWGSTGELLAYGESVTGGSGRGLGGCGGNAAILQHKGGNPMALVLPIQGVVGDQRGTGHRVCRRHTRRQRYWTTMYWHLSPRFDKKRFRLYNISVIEPV